MAFVTVIADGRAYTVDEFAVSFWMCAIESRTVTKSSSTIRRNGRTATVDEAETMLVNEIMGEMCQQLGENDRQYVADRLAAAIKAGNSSADELRHSARNALAELSAMQLLKKHR